MDHGKTWTGKEMCHKKCEKIDENLNFWHIFINHPRSTQKHSKIKKTAFSCKKRWFLNKMVRSTLPHHCLWTGLRLILGVPALMRDFDSIIQYFVQKYLTDQEILRQSIRTILELGARLIWAQSDHGKTCSGQEMCHKKCQKFWWFSKIWRFFEDDPRSTGNHF